MGKIKKVLALIMIFLLMFNILGYAEGEDNSDISEPDTTIVSTDEEIIVDKSVDKSVNQITDTTQVINNDEAANVLSALGILKSDGNGDFNLDETITRAQFVDMLPRLLGLDVNDSSSNKPMNFDDVDADYWASKSINIVYQMGIVNGYSDTEFKPEDTITYEQVIKVLVSILGYDIIAESKGGYPTGYLIVAAEKGISKKIDSKVKSGDPVTRGAVVQMIFNSLDVNMMQRVVFGIKYQLTEGRTLLNEILKIDKIRGVVTGNSITRLTGTSNLRKDQIEIGEKAFKTNNDKDKELLGYMVEAYIKIDENSDVRTIVYIAPQKGKNRELTVKAEDIEKNDAAFSSTCFVYNNQDRITRINILPHANLIYNGKAGVTLSANMLKPTLGSVTFLDADNSGTYEVVFVNQYKNIIVDGVNLADSIVYDKYNPASMIVLDSSDVGYEFELIKDGNAITLSDVKEWNVLSYYESRNEIGEIFKKVVVTDKKIPGKITELDNSNNEMWIDSQMYKIASGCVQADFSVNNEGDFYLDVEGEIAAGNILIKGSDNYGYLIGVKNMPGLDKTVQFRMFTANNKITVFDAYKKINFNNVSTVASDAGKSSLLVDSNNGAKRQLVKYGINGKGEINTLNTYIDDSTRVGVKDEFIRSQKNTNNTFRNGSQSFFTASGNHPLGCYVNKDTLIFEVPEDPNNLTATTDDNRYKVITTQFFRDSGQYSIDSYDLSEYKVASAVVVFETNMVIQGFDALLLVDKVATAIDADGNIVKKIYGIQKGKSVEYTAIQDSTLDNRLGLLKNGDVIRVWLNSQAQICNMLSECNSSTQYATADNGTDRAYDYGTIYGIVCSIDQTDGFFSVSDNASTANIVSLPITKAKVYVCNRNNNTISIGTLRDIDKEHAVFVRVYYGRAEEIIVYR